jgi:ribose 5-phosphate isomerase B
MIIVGDRMSLDWSLDSVVYDECQLVFVVRREHVYEHAIDKVLVQKYGPDIKIIIQDGAPQGSVASCLLAADVIDPELPLIIDCLDVHFRPQFNPAEIDWKAFDGLIATFKSNNPNYSYVQLAADNLHIEYAAEKEVISSWAASGIYGWSQAGNFFSLAREAMGMGDTYKTRGEFYVTPLYNLALHKGQQIIRQDVRDVHVIGTPEEVEFFHRCVWPYFETTKPLALASDHSGFQAKEQFQTFLKRVDIPFVDYGTYSDRDCDYVDFVVPAAEAVTSGRSNFGFVFCRSGQGPNIMANKIHGIRSALIYDQFSASHAVQHNAANFFSIPQHLFREESKIAALLLAIQSAEFEGGRHADRIRKVLRYEDMHSK